MNRIIGHLRTRAIMPPCACMTTENTCQVTDRRPIAARRFTLFHRLADRVARAGISANAISVAGMICGLIAGGCLYSTSSTAPPLQRIRWLAAAGLVQLRLLANLLDGMVAIAAGTASGFLWQRFPLPPHHAVDSLVRGDERHLRLHLR
jgi:hypothetical protein